MAKALNTMIQSGGGLLKSAKSAFDQENEDELKKASKEQGILTPTSPLGASSLGVSPDSQKMAGSGQQKLGISQQVAKLASDNSLAPKEATQEQKTKREQATKLQQMGQAGTGLKDRVNSIILGNITSQTTAAAGPEGIKNTISRVVTGSGVDAPNQARIQSLLSGNPLASDAEYEELGKALGLATEGLTGKQLSDTINSQYLVTTSGKLPFKLQENLTVADVAKTDADNNAATDWVQELKLGFNNEQDLEAFLGGEDVSGLTIAQLNEKVDNKVASNFSEIAAAQAKLNDPAASMQEKTAARELLTGLGQAGVLGSEQLAQGATRDTRKANTVTFMGQEWKPEELAKDPIFQNKSSEYYGKDAAGRKLLKDAAKSPSDKAFYEFLDANETSLNAIREKSTTTLSQVDKDLEEAKKGWSLGPLLEGGLNEKLMGQAAPKKIGQKIDDGKVTKAGKLMQGLNNLAKAGDPKATKQMEILSNFYKTQMPANIEMDVLNKSVDDLKNAGVWDEDPEKLKENLKNWSFSLQDQKFLENKDMSWQEMAHFFGLGHDEAQELAKNLKNLSGINPELSNILDANKDGQVDSPLSDVKKRIADKYGASNKAWKPGQKLFGDDLREMVANARTEVNKIPAPFRDGDVSLEDMDSILNQGIPSWQDFDKIVPKGIRIDKQVKTAAVNRIAQNEIKKVLPNADVFLGDGFAGANESLEDMQNGRNMIQDALDKLNGMQMDPRGGYELDKMKAAFRMKLAKVDGQLASKRAEAERLERERPDKERIQRESDRERERQKNPFGNLPKELKKIDETGISPIGEGVFNLTSSTFTPIANKTESGLKNIKKGKVRL